MTLEQSRLISSVPSCFIRDEIILLAILCRYLVDSHWFKQWKKYVGFDSWDKYQMGDQNVYPGPVDNSGLLRGKTDENITSLDLQSP